MAKQPKRPSPTKLKRSTGAPDSEALSRNLFSTMIAPPLMDAPEAARADAMFDIIIDLNLLHPKGLDSCKQEALAQIKQICKGSRRRGVGVGLTYPIASRPSRDDSSALGDAQDRFGGIGSDVTGPAVAAALIAAIASQR